MLNVAHLSRIWLPQTQTWMFNQIKYLPEDIECYIMCEQTENLDQFNLPRIMVFRKETGVLRYYWERILRRLRIYQTVPFYSNAINRKGIKVLHSHFGHSGWLNLQTARKASIKHVTTFYGADVNLKLMQHQVWMHRYNELFKVGNLFLCEGSHMAMCVEKLGCPSYKIKVHHLGVEVEKIAYKPRVLHDDEPLRVLIAASFTEKKGIPYGIEALGKISKNMPIELTLIGDAMHGAVEKEKIFKALEASNLINKTRLLGYLPYSKVFEEAYKHHLFLSPSVTAQNGDTEGGAPVSIIEMIATGMPVVSTTHCDIPSVINYGEDGWLAKERDVEGIVRILQKWIDEKDRWPILLSRVRKHIEIEYNSISQGRRLGRIYRELCNQ
jgi:colanic acid/amylovoran biosynthesis glycosyltransferase